MKKNTFVNLIVFFIVLVGVGSIIFLSLPRSQRDALYNSITGKYQTQENQQDTRNTSNDEPTTTSSTNENNYTQTEQQQSKPQRREVKEECRKCYGSGRCPDCGGNGSWSCSSHDTNRDGYCTNCSNTGRINCYSCYPVGSCKTCKGRGYRITYEYR